MNIVWDENAYKELAKLETLVARRITRRVRELAQDLFSKDVKKLKGSSDFRLRIGDYRVIFAVEGEQIMILKVGHRKNVYKGTL
jgi:mRNA interferase RelE/StbE